MNVRNVLIISYDWMPRNSIAVYRPYAWAKYWSEAGIDVTVLTAKKCTYDEPLGLDLPVPDSVRVVEIPYRSGATKAKKNWRIKASFTQFLKRNSSLIQKVTGKYFDVRDAWVKHATPVALDLMECQHYDVIISTYGPRSCHLIASNIKVKHPEVRWVADYRDMWSIRHDNINIKSQLSQERDLEKSTLESADIVTTVSKPLATELSYFLAKDVHTIFNGFNDHWDCVLERLSNINHCHNIPIKIVYTGMIYPNLRDPSPLFLAVNNLIEKKFIGENDIQIHFFGQRQPYIRDIITKCKAQNFTFVHGHISHERALEEQSQADLLLLLESGKPSAKGVLTGKIFEYMVSGTPVLSLGSKLDSSIGEIISETGIGFICCDDIVKIEEVLKKTINNEISKEYQPIVSKISKYSRKVQSSDFLQLINKSTQ